MQCEKTKRDGTRCRARALTGGCYCALHSTPEKAVELGRKGGRRRTVYKPDQLKTCTVKRLIHAWNSLRHFAILCSRESQFGENSISAIATPKFAKVTKCSLNALFRCCSGGLLPCRN